MLLTLFQLPIAGHNLFFLLLLLAVGFLFLAYGGDILTRGAAAVSVNLKITPIVVGLTVVSIATSMPEMATSLMAAKDNPGIALGNILGSNIANMALILGISAVIVPLRAEHGLISREVQVLIAMTVFFFIFAMTDGGFSRVEGLLLLCSTVFYLIYVVLSAKSKDTVGQFSEGNQSITRKTTKHAIFLILFGGILLALGGIHISPGSCVCVFWHWTKGYRLTN